MTPTQHTTSAAHRGLCKAIACALAELDGYDPKDEHGGLYDLRWSGGPNPEPEGDAWHMDYLPKAEKIAKALAASAPVAPTQPTRMERKVYRGTPEHREYLSARFPRNGSSPSNSFEWQGHRWAYQHTSFNDAGDYDLIYRNVAEAAPVAPAPQPARLLFPNPIDIFAAMSDAAKARTSPENVADVLMALAAAGMQPQPVPPEWLSDQYGGDFDDMTAGQGYRKGWNDCRSRMLAAAPKAEPEDPGPFLDDDGRAAVVNSHHYTPENIRALVAQLRAFSDPQQTTQADWDALDWRAHCNVLWRVMSALADEVVSATPLRRGEYLPLPEPDTHCHDEDTGKDVWSHSAGQMRAYVDADRAVRGAAQASQADIELIVQALEHSTPTAAHYPEPRERHVRALEAARLMLTAPPAPSAQDADPLQGAANWLVNSRASANATELGGRLCIGYNRAEWLFDAARAQQKGGA